MTLVVQVQQQLNGGIAEAWRNRSCLDFSLLSRSDSHLKVLSDINVTNAFVPLLDTVFC